MTGGGFGTSSKFDNVIIASESTSSATLTYFENDAPLAINDQLSLADVDHHYLQSAVLRIAGNYAATEDQLNFVDQNGISGTWDAITGTLTLVGNASIAAYEEAIRSVGYFNTSEDPSTALRTIDVTVNDGNDDSAVYSRDITIVAVNDAPVAVADTAIAVEAGGDNNEIAGVNPSGNVLANDTDVEAGDTKEVIGVSAGVQASAAGSVSAPVTGTYGSITIDANGDYIYTVDNNNPAVQALRTSDETVEDVFSYTIQDSGGLESTTQVTVTITGANDHPTDLNLTPTVAVKNLISLRLQPDYGGETNALTPPRFRVYADGAVIADGVANWGDGVAQTISVTLDGTKPNSIWGEYYNDDVGIGTDNRSLTVDYIELNGVRFEAEAPSVVLAREGQPDESGQEWLDEDATLKFDTSSAPLATAVYHAAVPENSTSAPIGELTTVDPDVTDTFTYSVDDNRFEVVAGQLKLKDAVFLDHETEPVVEITVTTTDAAGAQHSELFRLQVVNEAENPNNIAMSNLLVAENSAEGTVIGAASVTDGDLLDDFTYSLSGTDAGLFTIDADGVLRVGVGTSLDYETQSQYSVTIDVYDSSNNAYSQTFTISVDDLNEAPTVNLGLTSQVVNEDDLFEYVFDENAFADQDLVNGDELTFEATLADGTVLPDWLVFTSETRTFSGTPRNANVGKISVKVTARDKDGEEVSDTFEIDVINTNDDPFLNQSIPNQTAVEDSAFSFTFDDATFGDDDLIHGDTLSYSASLADGTPLPSWLTFDEVTRTFSGTPENEHVGTLTVRITAIDDYGSTTDGTFQLTVENTNDAPIAFDDNITAVEDGVAVVGTVTATDPDVGDSLVYTLISGPSEGSVAFQANGEYSFDPEGDFQDLAAGETRDVTFVFETQDTSGLTDQGTVTITVTGTNDGPVAEAGLNTATEDGNVVSGQLTSSDLDASDTHTYSLVSGTSEGWVTVNPDGSYSFDPGADFQDLAAGESRDVTFVFEVADNQGATSQETVTITVTGTNDGPVAEAGVNTATEDGSVVSGQLTSSDLDASDTHTYSLVSGTSEGWVTVNPDGSYSFDPGADFQDLAAGETRDVWFVFQAADNHGATSQETVTITVTGTNDGPVAVGDQAGTTEDESIRVDVLANDEDADANDKLEIVHAEIVDGRGTVEISENQLSFTPGSHYQHLAVGQRELVTIRYEIRDSQGALSQSTLEIEVDGRRDAMVLEVPELSGDEDRVIAWPIQLTAVDLDGERPTAIEVVGLPLGTQLSDGNGNFATISSIVPTVDVMNWELNKLSVKPPINYSGSFDIQVRLFTDHSFDVDQVHVTQMKITPVADNAILVVEPAAGQNDSEIPLSIKATLFDTDGSETLRLEVAELPLGASITDGNNLFEVGSQQTRVDISDWSRAALRLIPPTDFVGNIQLRVIATTTEVNGNQAVAESLLSVDILQPEFTEAILPPDETRIGEPAFTGVLEADEFSEPENRNTENKPEVLATSPEEASGTVAKNKTGANEFGTWGLPEDSAIPRNTMSWRDLVPASIIEMEPVWERFEIDSYQTTIQSNWRTQPLSLLNKAEFVPVKSDDDSEMPFKPTRPPSDDVGRRVSDAEEETARTFSLKQTFGMLWALARSLSGTTENTNPLDVAKFDQRTSRTTRHRH